MNVDFNKFDERLTMLKQMANDMYRRHSLFEQEVSKDPGNWANTHLVHMSELLTILIHDHIKLLESTKDDKN